MVSEYGYNRAIRDNAAAGEAGGEIPFPGLAASRSQLAVPLLAGPRMIGVLYVESPLDMRFSYDDEDVLVALGAQLALSIDILRTLDDEPLAPDAIADRGRPARAAGGAPLPRERQRVPGRRLPDQGRGRFDLHGAVRDCVEKGRTESPTASCGWIRACACPTSATISKGGCCC